MNIVIDIIMAYFIIQALPFVGLFILWVIVTIFCREKKEAR